MPLPHQASHLIKANPIAFFLFLLALLMASTFCSSSSYSAEVPFGDRETIAWDFPNAGSRPGVYEADLLELTDMDGDGDIDVLSVSDYRIFWFENANSDGSAWTTHTIESDLEPVSSIYPCDIDGDGDLDVLCVHDEANEIYWWENIESNGTSWAFHVIVQGYTGTSRAFPGDLDKDGDIDIASEKEGAITWLENDGIPQDKRTASEISWTEHIVQNERPYLNISLPADIDTDGTLDVITIVFGSGTVYIYRNVLGDGTLWIKAGTAGYGVSSREIFSVDMDGDSDMDFCFEGIAWSENLNGDATSWEVHVLPFQQSTTGGSSFQTDLDLDTDIDVLLITEFHDFFYHENRDGSATSWNEYTPFQNSSGHNIRAADLDGDGDPDVVVRSWGSIVWWENQIEVIQITSPRVNDAWIRFLTYEITWTTSGTTDYSKPVSIELYREGSFETVIAESTPNDGSYEWSIPLEHSQGDDYTIRIAYVGVSPEVEDFSDGAFSIRIAPPVLDSVVDAGDGTTSLTWTNTVEEPAQFLALAWDIYDGKWVERGWNDTLWYNYSSNSRTGAMDLGHSGAYHIWVAGHHGGGEIAFCDNPWTGIVYSGEPHQPINVTTVPTLDPRSVQLQWKSDIYGTWLYWIIAYNVDTKEWVATQGPLGESVWHYVAHGSGDFKNGSTLLTLQESGRYRFFIAGVGWDGVSWGELAHSRVVRLP